MMDSSLSLAALPFLPLDPAWLEQSRAFSSADPRLAVAHLRLVVAAWRGVPAASIPRSLDYIVQATGLSREVAEKNMDVLTEGFVALDNDRLQHAHLAKLAGQILARYGDAITEIALSSAMAMQDPERFGVVAVEMATAKARGVRALPRGFGYAMHPELQPWLRENGYPMPEDQEYILEKFTDYARANNRKSENWPAAMRDFVRLQVCRNDVPPSRRRGVAVVGAGTPARSLGATGRGQAALDNNLSLFTNVTARRQGSRA